MFFVIVGVLIILTNLADIGPFAGWTWEALGPSPSFAISALFGALGAALVAWKVRV